MKIAVIGNETFPVIQCAIAIAELMRTIPTGSTVLTRGSKGFDVFAGECARYMGYGVEEFPGKGGSFNFDRDVRIVAAADEVWGFFDPDRVGQGGTQHIIEKALDRGIPVRSYTAIGRQVVMVGSHDGEDQEGRPAQAPRGQAFASPTRPPEPPVEEEQGQVGHVRSGGSDRGPALPGSGDRRDDRPSDDWF